jgi:hypothetical protein
MGEPVTNSLEGVWQDREERLLPELFGQKRNGIFVLNAEVFTDIFGAEEFDPRWLFLGVFEFEPTEARNSWLYVTSGGSTPWETEPAEYNPEEFSWLGVEFVIEAPCQSDWAIRGLQRLLAYHVMCTHGYFGDNSGLGPGHRVPAGGSVDGKTSTLKFFAATVPEHYTGTGYLASGKFEFLHFVGITEKERDFAKQFTTKALVEKLKLQGAYPVTDPKRKCIRL